MTSTAMLHPTQGGQHRTLTIQAPPMMNQTDEQNSYIVNLFFDRHGEQSCRSTTDLRRDGADMS
jgi:hypothetical protein